MSWSSRLNPSSVRALLIGGLIAWTASPAAAENSSVSSQGEFNRKIFEYLQGVNKRLGNLESGDLKPLVDGLEQSMDRIVNWEGTVDAEFYRHNQSSFNDRPPQEAFASVHLIPSLKLNRDFQARIDLLARGDAENVSRNTVRLDEGYVEAHVGSAVTLRAGKRIFNWGSTDLYNPTDLVNPRDYYDLLNPDKLGVYAASATLQMSPALSFEAVLVPVFEPSVVADSTSRWIDYSDFIRQPLTSAISLPPGFTSGGYDVTFGISRKTPTMPQAYGRLTFDAISASVAATYAFRYNPTPSDLLFGSNVSFDVINNRPVVGLEGIPYYSMEHVVGLDVSVPISKLVLFASSTLHLPSAQESAVSAEQQLANLSSLGISTTLTADQIRSMTRQGNQWQLSGGLRAEWSWLKVRAQYVRMLYFGGNQPGEVLRTLISTHGGSLNQFDFRSLQNFLSGTVIPAVELRLSDRLWLQGGAIVSFERSDGVYHLGFNWQLKEGLDLDARYTLLYGSQGSILYSFGRNSRAEMGLKVRF